jgi:hypothetical protein
MLRLVIGISLIAHIKMLVLMCFLSHNLESMGTPMKNSYMPKISGLRPSIRRRPGTKFSRGRDQVESAGAGIKFNRDFEMLPRPGPGLGKICRVRNFLSHFGNFRKFPETRINVLWSIFINLELKFFWISNWWQVLASMFFIWSQVTENFVFNCLSLKIKINFQNFSV